MSRQFRFDDVPSDRTSLELASGALPLSDELQFHAMMLLLLNAPLFTLILRQQQWNALRVLQMMDDYVVGASLRRDVRGKSLYSNNRKRCLRFEILSTHRQFTP